MKLIKLNNELEIPVVGTGTNTYGKEGNAFKGELRGDTEEVDWAVENGYRHFDAAQIYANEEVVGKGLNQSGVKREDYFITTKLNTNEGYVSRDWIDAEINKSLEKLQTDYIDLFLIHFPWDNSDEIVEVWHVLEEYYNRGIFKSIGVSNFEEKHLDLVLQNGTVKPAVNQIESHVGKWNDALIDYNKSNDIATVAWSPLAGIEDDAKQVLQEIGDRYGKTYAQVVLRYQIERDVIVIPKSHNKERQAQSLDIFDFELTADDRERIAAL
ncbi:aldo/keto reductase family protein [Salinicoccus hispanicus]|uniref:Aldo/keto reductase n=1 Tax=Salinicoccus hispanicus TaxID=157225 RepID=A0A6N8TX55_9STAP|nr:aldo/keto reductase [Salinicoccus hispanicus]MXQ50002.1 aldo/keto reductase [Salinicoccus hispanicus]